MQQVEHHFDFKHVLSNVCATEIDVLGAHDFEDSSQLGTMILIEDRACIDHVLLEGEQNPISCCPRTAIYRISLLVFDSFVPDTTRILQRDSPGIFGLTTGAQSPNKITTESHGSTRSGRDNWSPVHPSPI
jgi:hypothetical protein